MSETLKPKTNTLAIVALILGGIAFITGWIPVVGLLFGAAAIVFAILALVKAQSKLMAIVGGAAGAIGAITSIIVLGIVIAVTPSLTDPAPQRDTAATPSPSPSATVDPTPTATPSETQSPSPEPAEPAPDLAADVEAALLTELGLNTFPEGLARDTSNHLFYIASIENHIPGTVRITIQDALTRDEAQTVGTRAFSLVGMQLPNLDTIIITEAGGVDRANIYRHNVPILNR